MPKLKNKNTELQHPKNLKLYKPKILLNVAGQRRWHCEPVGWDTATLRHCDTATLRHPCHLEFAATQSVQQLSVLVPSLYHWEHRLHGKLYGGSLYLTLQL